MPIVLKGAFVFYDNIGKIDRPPLVPAAPRDWNSEQLHVALMHRLSERMAVRTAKGFESYLRRKAVRALAKKYR